MPPITQTYPFCFSFYSPGELAVDGTTETDAADEAAVPGAVDGRVRRARAT